MTRATQADAGFEGRLVAEGPDLLRTLAVAADPDSGGDHERGPPGEIDGFHHALGGSKPSPGLWSGMSLPS